MLIAAISDVHYPRFSELFHSALKNANDKRPCFVILAGDIINRGDARHFPVVINLIRENFGKEIKILACFGNEEYEDVRDALKKQGDVKFLEEEILIEKFHGKTIAFIGSQGVIDSPTPWQKRHIPNIKEIYEKRIKQLKKLILQAKEKADITVVFSHYAPSYKTLKGEEKSKYPFLGSVKMEKVIAETQPDIAIHGHAHHGSVYAEIGKTRIYNVALPLRKAFTFISLEEKIGLERFW